MAVDERRPEPGPPGPTAGRWSPWKIFGVATAVTACWLAFGARLVGLYVVLVDPAAILAYGAACAIAASRMRTGRGLTLRGMACAVGFFAALSFVLTRTQIGFGDSCAVRLVVTIVDSASGEPVPGATVVAVDDGSALARATTDGRGVASLGFESQVLTEHSWLTSRRTFAPEGISVRVRADSYAPSERRVALVGERRVHSIEGPLGRPPKEILIRSDVPLERAGEGDVGRATGAGPGSARSRGSGPPGPDGARAESPRADDRSASLVEGPGLAPRPPGRARAGVPPAPAQSRNMPMSRRILFATHSCYLDTTNGAAAASRAMMQALARGATRSRRSEGRCSSSAGTSTSSVG